jgi:alkylated DNA repair dioxygenase AlkB
LHYRVFSYNCGNNFSRKPNQTGILRTCAFDRVLLNYYRDGNDSVAWHSDTLPADGKHHPIASVTFGETRQFKVRHKLLKKTSQLSIPLTHGSFLLMGEAMQDHYEHHVPKTSRRVGGRINLTFRISEWTKPIYHDKNE